MSDQRALMEDIQLGIDVETFIQSEVCQYLLGRVDQERKDAVEAFTKADPANTDLIRSLQNVIHRADSFEQWLGEAVQVGLYATQQLKEREYD